MNKTDIFLTVMVILMFLMMLSIPIYAGYNLFTTSKLIEEFCEDRGYDSKGSDCYKIDPNDRIERVSVSIIDGEVYFEE